MGKTAKKRFAAAVAASKHQAPSQKHRREKRELEKMAKLKPKKKLSKDPGVPNLGQVKDKMAEELERRKAKLQAQQDNIKAKRAQALQAQRNDRSMQDEHMGLFAMCADAARREAAFEATSLPANAFDNDYKQGSNTERNRKQYYRELKEVVEAADVLVEVLDARDPVGCRCKKMEELITHNHPNKHVVLLLNKIDLVPGEIAARWVELMRNEFPTLTFKASTSQHRHHMGRSSTFREAHKAPADLLASSECVGAEDLIQLLKNYARSGEIKKNIVVGVVGYPNVGKSSVINSLKRSRAVAVGAMPGLTKATQEVHLDKDITLMDCPGLILSTDSEADCVLRNAISIFKLDDPVAPVQSILEKCRLDNVMGVYNIAMEEFVFNGEDTVMQFLSLVARKMGKLQRGGIPDYQAAARAVLQDWNDGKIPFYTIPPGFVPSAVVAEQQQQQQQQQAGMMAVDGAVGSGGVGGGIGGIGGAFGSHASLLQPAFSSSSASASASLSGSGMVMDDG